MRIVARYQFKEVWVPLLVWVGFLFLILFVMSFLRGTDVLLGSAVTLKDFAKFILFLAPNFLQQAIPVAFLLALLLGLGRLSEDGETTAMRSLGLGPWQMLSGPLVLGAVLGGVMWALSLSLTPMGLRAVKETVNDIIKRNLVGDVKSGVFYDDLSDVTLYAERVRSRERKWQNVLVHDGRDPDSALLVLAREGRVKTLADGEDLKLVLLDGVLHRPAPASLDYTKIRFEKAEILIGVGESFFQKNRFRSPKEEMTFGELRQAREEARLEGDDGRTFDMAIHWRFGQAVTPLAYAFLGTSLALTRKQGGRARGGLLTILGYIAYYVLARTMASFGERGLLSPWVAAKGVNFLFAAIGAFGLWRKSRARVWA